jgi:hypothetical protein
MRLLAVFLVPVAISTVLQASNIGTTINTNNPTDVTAFQQGATVVDFENVTGVTPDTITSYASTDPVGDSAKIFDQISGVLFSVGGMKGVDIPAVYKLSGGLAGDAKSGTNVLGSVNFNDFTPRFDGTSLIEILFTTKVQEVGFWLNPSLGDVSIIAATTNFALSGDPNEVNLDTATVTAGNFVGFKDPTADIGGFKIQALSTKGFSIDDFTFGSPDADTTATPEPSTTAISGAALLLIAAIAFRRKRLAGEAAPSAHTSAKL